MKKLIISAISAAALLFGFASCSGDLHDMNDAPIVEVPTKIVGAINYGGGNVFSDMVKVDELTSTYTFIYSAGMSANWGSPSDGVAFKVGYTENGWSTCWGQETAGNTPLADGKGEVICKVQNSDKNIAFAGLTAGKTYKITAKAGKSSVTVSIEETAGSAAPAESAPVPYYLDGYAVRSLDAAWNVTADNLLYNPTEDKATGNLTYKLDFIASAGSQKLAIARKDWTEGRWECSEAKSFAVDAEPIFLESGKEQHPTVTGLTVDNPYRIYVYTTPEKKVSMKVVGLTNVEVTPTVSVTGLPEALNGTTLYFTGDFNGWKEPSKDGSIECKVTGGSVSVTLPKVSKAFETGEAQEFSYQGKFASAGWTKPEITNDAGENISFKVTSDKHTVKGTFKTTKEKDDGTLYLCDWTVE